jgi:hypothetical protein
MIRSELGSALPRNISRHSPDELWNGVDDSRQRIPQKLWAGGLRRASGVPPIRGLSRFADAGRQPPHYLLVRIATGWDSFHRLLSEGLGLLFGLSLVLRKQHPFADDFSPRLVFRLHAQDPLLARGPPDAVPPSVGRLRCIINIAVFTTGTSSSPFRASRLSAVGTSRKTGRARDLS